MALSEFFCLRGRRSAGVSNLFGVFFVFGGFLFGEDRCGGSNGRLSLLLLVDSLLLVSATHLLLNWSLLEALLIIIVSSEIFERIRHFLD